MTTWASVCSTKPPQARLGSCTGGRKKKRACWAFVSQLLHFFPLCRTFTLSVLFCKHISRLCFASMQSTASLSFFLYFFLTFI